MISCEEQEQERKVEAIVSGEIFSFILFNDVKQNRVFL